MAKINWTAESELWLKDIYDYIIQDNPKAATCTIEGIYDQAQLLLEFPKMGYKYKQNTERNIRILIYGHYRIAYLIKPNDDIDILGVFHGSIDIKRYLY